MSLHRLSSVVVAVLIAHVVLATPYWSNLVRAFKNDGLTYGQRRVVYSFNGIPIDQIVSRLDSLLPAGARVALGDSIKGDFPQQRLTEGLYPRVVDRNASFRLEFVQDGDCAQGTAEVIRIGKARFCVQGEFKSGTERAVTPYSDDFSFSAFFAALTAVFGIGLLIVPVLNPSATLFVPIAFLCGASAIGLIGSLATWFQTPWSSLVFWLAGLGFVFSIVRVVRRANTQELATSIRAVWQACIKRPECFGLMFLLILFSISVALYPVSMWDGRSVWFFNTKKFFMHGMFFKGDLLHADFQWSNPIYPVLLPAWFAHFTSFADLGGSPVYNERMASLGIPVFLGALVASLWIIARASLGRWIGAALAVIAFFMSANMSAGGYADQYVSLLAVLAVLSLASDEYERLGWLWIFLCSMLKVEGFVLAALITGIYLIFHPRSRERWKRRQFLNWLAGATVLLPAVVHRLWASHVGVKSVFTDSPFSEIVDAFVDKLITLFVELPSFLTQPGYTQTNFIYWEGLLALFVCIALWIKRKKLNWPQSAAVIASVGFFAIACVSVIAMPYDIRWAAHVTLERLLYHPSMLLLSAGMSAMVTNEN
jgi:hypothetical protein